MSETRKITHAEQDLRRKANRLKRAKRKIEKEIWDTIREVWRLMYRKNPEEGER